MNKTGFNIGTRLALGFGGVFFLILVLCTLAVMRVISIDDSLIRINEVNNVKQRYAINLRGSVHDRAISLRDVVLVADVDVARPHVERIARLADSYAKSAAPLDALFSKHSDISAEEKAALAAIKENARKTEALIAKVIELRSADQVLDATVLLSNQAGPAFVEWLASLNHLIDLEETLNAAEAKNAADLASSFFLWMCALGGIAIAVGSVAAWYISRGLLRQLGGQPDYAASIVGSIAAGNLAVEIKTAPGDQASLLFAMKGMRDSLVAIVAQVRAGTSTITSASTEIAAGNVNLSARTESQAGTLEETASSMEELTGTVRQNADNARQANVLAVSASEVALRGGEVVSQVVETMSAINDSSRKIVDIIAVIDGIAFQTNILALNAAVEAARAGEQGRGFAVVASEVRNLAQRSAAAAKEIKGLIGDSVERVDAGARLVDQAGSTMQEIVSSVKRVTDIMAEITLASQEQTAGIEQVNQAIGQMDEATQQNAALVEQATAAADALNQEAAALARVVGVFVLDSAASASVTPIQRAAPRAAAGAAPARPQRQIAQRAVANGKAVDDNRADDWETF